MPGKARVKSITTLPDFIPNAEPVKTIGPKTEWLRITPELATKWLDERNKNNRSVREFTVAKYAADMKEGKWKGLNGEAICFDTAGRLVDGQHRLYACLASRHAFESLVVWGVAPDAYTTIDVGLKKQYSDFLGPMGEKNATLLASAIRLVYLWKNSRIGNPREQASSESLNDTFAENPDIRKSVKFVSSNKDIKNVMISSHACLIHYAGMQQGKHYAVEMFLEQVCGGLGLIESSPAYHLRRFLLGLKAPHPGRRRFHPSYVMALTIKAWNAFRDERPMQSLMFRANEDFPTL